MNDSILKTQAFKLKGRLYTLTVLAIIYADEQTFTEQLIDVIAQAPNLFQGTPLVLDCSSMKTANVNLEQICHLLRENGLLPIAVQGGNKIIEGKAKRAGLAVLNASSNHDKAVIRQTVQDKKIPGNVFHNKLITVPVRSGQQVVSKGDLTVTAAVSYGAELLANGHIHVYGALRGRALAGIEGNKQARIFCQTLEAELVSIAGFYRLRDNMEPITGPCQIYLHDDQIHIESI